MVTCIYKHAYLYRSLLGKVQKRSVVANSIPSLFHKEQPLPKQGDSETSSERQRLTGMYTQGLHGGMQKDKRKGARGLVRVRCCGRGQEMSTHAFIRLEAKNRRSQHIFLLRM